MRWQQALTDWGPVLVVGAVSMTGLALEQPWLGSDLELAATSLATALPLAVRRQHPFAVAVAIAVVAVAQTTVLGEALHFGSFLGAVVATYSAARYLDLRPALGALAIVLAGVGVAQAESVARNPAELVYPLVYFGGVWLLGRGARRLAEQGARLRSLNTALERDRESRAALAVAQERLRLARELHDTLGHRLVLMVVQAQAAQQTLATDAAATAESLETVRRAGQEGMQELRQLVDVLHETPLDDDLDRLVARMDQAGLTVSLRAEDVPEHLTTLLHRVVQESLTNVLKHSEARSVDVMVATIGPGSDSVEVEVVDPGPRRTATGSGGRGLAGMRGRVEEHGGRLVAEPHGAGFRVRAVLPVEAAR